jgi:hypothetical protein
MDDTQRNDLIYIVLTFVFTAFFQQVAQTGSPIEKNGLCTLAHNIINEKIFLILYFWYFTLNLVSLFFVIYRLATIFVASFRERVILFRARGGALLAHPLRYYYCCKPCLGAQFEFIYYT